MINVQTFPFYQHKKWGGSETRKSIFYRIFVFILRKLQTFVLFQTIFYCRFRMLCDVVSLIFHRHFIDKTADDSDEMTTTLRWVTVTFTDLQFQFRKAPVDVHLLIHRQLNEDDNKAMTKNRKFTELIFHIFLLWELIWCIELLDPLWWSSARLSSETKVNWLQLKLFKIIFHQQKQEKSFLYRD